MRPYGSEFRNYTPPQITSTYFLTSKFHPNDPHKVNMIETMPNQNFQNATPTTNYFKMFPAVLNFKCFVCFFLPMDHMTGTFETLPL